MSFDCVGAVSETATLEQVRSGGFILRVGSRGPSVQQIQNMLGVSADGVFGKNTEDAVIKFQTSRQLKADGIVGKETLTALESQGGAVQTKLPVKVENVKSVPKSIPTPSKAVEPETESSFSLSQVGLVAGVLVSLAGFGYWALGRD